MAETPLEIDVAAVSQLQKTGENFLLLDVRNPDEFATARIPGSLLIPMSEIAARTEEIEAFRTERIVVHCHHGGRSMRVTQFLRQHGFEHAQNMAGGIDAWSQLVDASVPRY